MKLKAHMQKRHFAWLIMAIIATSTAMMSVPVFSLGGNVTFDLTHYYPDGYVHGVPIGEYVAVDVYVDASALPDKTLEGMRGWGLYVTVNPTVLTPVAAYGAAAGYFLYDWSLVNYPPPFPGDPMPYPPKLMYALEADGIECSEFLVPSPPTGAGGVGKLCTLYFRSQSETAYSPLTIKPYPASGYADATGATYPINAVNGHYNPPPGVYHTLTVESTPIDGIDFTIDSTTYTTNCSVSLLEGFYTVTMPSTWMVGIETYIFRHWEDSSTDPLRVIPLTADKTIIATYELMEARPPVAVIEAPFEEYVDKAVTFDGSQSHDPDGGSIVSYRWDFGDGDVISTTNPTIVHTYVTIGTYEVKLVVTDDENQESDPATCEIRIKGPIEGIQELIVEIKSWSLPKGTEKSLTAKLEEAIHLLNKGNENGAIHTLTDFISKVEALRKKGQLEDWQADHLVAEAQTIISII